MQGETVQSAAKGGMIAFTQPIAQEYARTTKRGRTI